MNKQDIQALQKYYLAFQKKLKDFCQEKKRPLPTLVAVTKGQALWKIQALYELGHRDFGENYVQELEKKAHALDPRSYPGIRWHFLGHLQKNKIKKLLPHLSVLHSLDSIPLYQKLIQLWPSFHPEEKLSLFIQVNVDKEVQKHGFLEEELPAFFKLRHPPFVNLLGWMVIPKAASLEERRKSFQKLKKLHKKYPFTQGFFSMGMSEDYEIALEEGSHYIRIGRALLGERLT